MSIDVKALERDLIAKGLLIEAGWASLRAMAVPAAAPQVQLDEMRNAFFAGAAHLFSAIMSTFDEGDEPTEADCNRLDLIQAELARFIMDYTAKHLRPQGQA